MRAGDLDLGAHLPISLAKVVLDFMKSHSSEAEEIYFNVVKICYKFAEAGVMALSLSIAVWRRHTSMPVTFWPPGSQKCRVGEETYTALVEHTRRLYWRPPPVGRQAFEDITNQLERND
ncbi:hypothetical protein FA13DRAFT_1744754, partial [Coprinellus micaceus]